MAGLLDQYLGNPEGGSGLLGNSAFRLGLGLLQASQDRRINPITSGLQGLLGAQQFRGDYADQQYKIHQQEAEQALQKTMGGLLNPTDPTTEMFRPQAQNQMIDPLMGGPSAPGTPGLLVPPIPQPGPGSLLDPQTRSILGALSKSDPKTAATLYTSAIGDATRTSTEHLPGPRIQYWKQYEELQKQEAAGQLPQGTADKFFESTLAKPALIVGQGGDITTRDPLTGAITTSNTNQNRIPLATRLEAETKMAGTNAEKQTIFQTEYPGIARTLDNHLQDLVYLRSQMAALNTGPILGDIKAKLLSDYQAANAVNSREALQTMGSLKDMGVSLTPMSEPDRQAIFNVSAQMTNDRDANLKIIDHAISLLQRQRGQIGRVRAKLAGGAMLKDIQPDATDSLGAPLSSGAPPGLGDEAARTLRDLGVPGYENVK